MKNGPKEIQKFEGEHRGVIVGKTKRDVLDLLTEEGYTMFRQEVEGNKARYIEYTAERDGKRIYVGAHSLDKPMNWEMAGRMVAGSVLGVH